MYGRNPTQEKRKQVKENTKMEEYNKSPSLAFYHANGKCTGCAAKFTVIPASVEHEGCVYIRLANQKTVADGNNSVFPSFDWDNSLVAKLDFTDASKLIQVFRGETESIMNGLRYKSETGVTFTNLSHKIEPVNGYLLVVEKMTSDTPVVAKSSIYLTPAEALGLALALEQSMSLLAFGIVYAGTMEGERI